jgi:trehalose-6-phosphate synthase
MTSWEGRRVVIAAMFLPVSSQKKSETAVVFQTTPVIRRNSFISAVKAATQPVIKKPLVLQSDTKFSSSITGNPGLYQAIGSVSDLGQTLWIGTVGTETDHLNEIEKNELSKSLEKNHSCLPVFLATEELEGHYHRFCKQVLWKPFHYQLPDYPKPKGFEENAWEMYVRVNQLFAQRIIEVYRAGDIIWVNDYHLMLVPEMVRKAVPHAIIGFFLHIPFPSSEIFRCLTVRKEILMGLLGADLIGFQIHAFMRHFLMTCSRILGLDSTLKGIALENSTVAVGSFPIGIDLATLDRKRLNPEVATIVAFLKKKYQGKYVVIGRDKNDYVKGVRHKLMAFERLLIDHPWWIGKVVLIQVSLPTSEANQSQSNVSDLVSRINSKFGSLEYVPVVYLHQDISFNHYLALLSMADACLITSIRDGMNLTSHEYVVCQEEKKSPLIISEFAGTYGNFGAALRVNPWDTKEVADAIHEALSMTEEEKTYRWGMLYSYVTSNTAQQFVKTFIGDLVAGHLEYTYALSTSIPKFSFESIHEVYSSSKKRLLVRSFNLVP